jgi:hypothetical protein
MATMAEITTDKRIDDLRAEMHRGFDRVEADFRELRVENRVLRSEMNQGFESTQASFGDLQRLMIRFFAGTLGSIVAGVVLLFVTRH